VDSPKSEFELLHSSTRWPPYGSSEISRLLKVEHYMSHVRIKMRSGGCVIFSQYTGARRGSKGYSTGSIARGTACLTRMCI
jgi:hypothetical protein